MKLFFNALWVGFLGLSAAVQVFAAGAAGKLSGYATAGANPAVVFIAVDSQGNGVRGVPVNITCTTGTLSLVAGNTGADGTLTVVQSGGVVGDQITATSPGLTGSPLVITTASAQTVKNTDTVIGWYDESRRLVNAVAVTTGTGVLASNALFNITTTDYSSDSRPLALGQNTNLTQTASGPAQVEVMQGTFNAGDRVNINETTVAGATVDAYLYFSNVQPANQLYAYAAGGANPSVVAVVTDARGVGVEGVTVTAASTAGSMTPATGYTAANGTFTFTQTGGSLGDTITVSCTVFPETSAVRVVTETSPAIAASNKIFSWFARKTRKVFSAVTNRASNVLVTPGSGDHLLQDYVNISGNGTGPYGQTGGLFIDQTAAKPAVLCSMVFGVTEAGDLVRIYQNTVVFRYSTYQSILELPANESRYLLAFASGGANPTVWAAVTNGTGNAVLNVPVHFDLQGAGALSQGDTVTGWSGYAQAQVAGGALGNTITVSSPGLGVVTIYAAASQAVTATDRMYAWYVPSTHQVFAAPVTFENNVLEADGTTVTTGYVKKHVGNNYPSYASFTPVAAPWPCLGQVGFGTVEAGDHLILYQAATSHNYDAYLIADADPAKILVAFAQSGVDPKVWAVVMDNKGNALENEPVVFSTASGSMSLGTTVTGWGGMVASQHTSGLLGNTITVWAPGLTPVMIYTAASNNLGVGDRGAVWYDASRLMVWGAEYTYWNNILTTNTSYWTSQVYDNSPSNGRNFSINDPLGHNPARLINPLASWAIAQGTAEPGDELLLGTYSYYAFIRIGSVRASYLRAYATYGQNPSLVRALVITRDGVGIPNTSVNFTCTNGFMANGPSWKTGYDGTVDSGQSSGMYNDIITVTSAGYPPVQILTNNSGGVSGTSPTLAWYSAADRKLNTIVLQYAAYNVTVYATTPTITFIPADATGNNRTLGVSGPKEDAQQQPTYGYVAEGTSGSGDVIRVQTMTAAAADDATVVLPADASRYLWAFAAGGANPRVWAAVTDAGGNGIAGAPVRIVYPGPVTVNLATDASGATSNARAGVNLGDTLLVEADGIANTVTVKVSASANVDPSTRTVGWYDVLSQTGYSAFVNVPNHVLTGATSASFSPVDTTPNGRAFALGSAVQQTTGAPASCPISNGTQGQGDIIQADESTTSANPDLQLSINVPTSELDSSITLAPDPAINGNTLTVTLSVFNNGTPAALNVSPTALAVAGTGGLAYVSGPLPAFAASLPGGSSQDFVWTYRATAPGNVSVTGQAMGVDSYTLLGLTSTASFSNRILVRDPLPPVIVSALGATPSAVLTYQSVTVTMTVANNSSTDVPNPITVTPSPLTVTGPAALAAGPSPASWFIPRGETRDFTWIYTATAPGSVTFTGQAFTTNPFDASGVTSTAATSNEVNVRDPHAPYLVPVLTASPVVRTLGQSFTVSMSVSNASDAEVPEPVTVTPSTLTVAGPGVWISGPTPASWLIPRGESRAFTWSYTGASPGSVTLTGRAYTVNPFDASGVTSSAVSSNGVLIQSPAALTGTLAGPPQAEQNQPFTLTMTLRNTGQADALAVSPVNLTVTGTGLALPVAVPTPCDIPGGASRDFIWTYAAGGYNGSLQFAGQARGYDANTGNTVTAASMQTSAFQIVQGALNLDLVTSPVARVYRGQKGLEVNLFARNTSLAPVTLTAASLTFNGKTDGYTVTPLPDNPVLVPGQTAFTLRFMVDVGKDVPAGPTTLDGSIAGVGVIPAPQAIQTASWEILEAFNQIQQNYPNPLRLAEQGFTTFDYFVKEDVKVTLKLYSLSGELVAVLVDGQPGVGRHQAVWNGANGDIGQRGSTVGSGVYLAVFCSGDYKEIRKVVVIR